jgi:hypothetical protein
MDGLKQIANVAGYPGLYRILKPGRSGVIVESLDGKKEKTMMGPTARVSVLHDISIYVDRSVEEPSVPLGEVLLLLNERYGESLPVTHKADGPDLVEFMEEALPDYDREKVRLPDIKKLVNWYSILRQHAPDLFEVPAMAEAAPETEATVNPTDSQVDTTVDEVEPTPDQVESAEPQPEPDEKPQAGTAA